MRPEMQAGEIVFCRAEIGKDYNDYAQYSPLGCFNEGGDDGLTLFMTVEGASAAGLGFDSNSTYKRITLKIHSSLEAIGLTAAVSKWLAEASIPANVVAAFFHDHIFVPTAKAEQAIAVLIERSGCAL